MKMLLEGDILKAIKNTHSNAEAARYLGVDSGTYKKYASLYMTQDGTQTLYQSHLNMSGKGTFRYNNFQQMKYSLDDILAGKHPHYSLQHLKTRLVREGILKEECEMCGFSERRITDKSAPILLAFRDGDRHNWKLENLEMLCYCCFHLYVGNVVGKKNRVCDINLLG